uniref:Uncharacterized protein n=1 Tax=Schistocephalus solidus TaxID=70667 RepID=A0A0X3PN28_SCHSO
MREGLKSVRVDDNPPFVPSPVSCSGLNCGLAVVTATTEACLTSKPICITGDATESSGSEDSSDGNSPLPTDSPTSSEGFFAEYPPPKSPRRRSRRPHRPPLTHNASTDSGVSEPPLKPHLPTCTAVVHNTLNHRLRRQQIHYLSSDSQPQSDQSPLLPRSPPASPPLNHKEAALLHGYPLNARQITYSGPPVLPYPIGVSFVQTVYGILPAPIGFFPHNSLRHSAPSSEYRSQTSSKALIPPPFLPPPAGVMLDLTGMDVSVSVERLPPVHPRPLSFPPRHPFPPAYKAQLEQQQQQSPPPPYRGHHPAWPATSPATTYRRSLFSSSPASSVSSDEALASSESDEDLHHSNSDSLSSLTEDSPSARQSYLALRYRQLAVRGSQPVGWKPTHYPLQHNIHCLHHHHHQQYNQEQYAPFHVGAPHPALIHIPTPLRLPRAQDHCKSLRTCLVPYSEFRNCKLLFSD